MRVKDLRPSAGAGTPELSIHTSAASELLNLMGVLSDRDDEYDIGPQRLAELRSQLAPELLEELRHLDMATGVSFHVLSLLAADLPHPAGVDELLVAFEADVSKPWRLLITHHLVGADAAGPNLPGLDAAIQGDPDALEALLAQARADAPSSSDLTSLLAIEPEELGTRLIAAITAIRPLWEEVAPEAMNPVLRDAAHRQRQLDEGVDVAEIVLEATNGYELSSDPSVHRIILQPSYWIRPWLIVGRSGDAEVLTTAVAEEFLILPAEAPSPALLKLFKALGDESRLTLLRRLSSGPITLAEATAELDVAKATTHHHLSILRQAGLVSVGGEGRISRYRLREDPAQVAAEALTAYLQPLRPRSTGS
ncbi:MAG: ArsR/SmtB family transcription factor [Nitriliruptoraceae bacterium]